MRQLDIPAMDGNPMTATLTILPWLAPTTWLLGSLVVRLYPAAQWTIAKSSATTALLVAVATIIAAIHALSVGVGTPDLLGVVMVTLIVFLGWVIVRFSHDYLAGEPGQNRYVGALLFTISAVLVVVLTQHFAVLILAWSASSIGLYYLLTFYQDRRPAQIVAHKKFLASRLAEIFLLAGMALIYTEAGTLWMDGIANYVAQQAELSAGMRLAAFLIALGVIFKSAQLPVHGWLIKVMEAPTPVSALLHAGIVNIGGFVLIRMASLFSAAPEAQALLVVVGSLTALLAGLVMMTRISIKVRLAWSTCAQMGFMLMQCGMGLYDLALLHLVAHSLYKAHAFLTAGDTVIEVRKRDLSHHATQLLAQTQVFRRILAVPIALMLVFASDYLWQTWLTGLSISNTASFVVALGLASLLWGMTDVWARSLLLGLLRVLILTQLYLLWHWGFTTVIPPVAAPSLPLGLWVIACFTALYGLQVWLLANPKGALSQKLYPWAYAGFYLDEYFTRLAFRVWPADIGTEHSHGINPHLRKLKREQA
jgi:NAD(P)H-quinone oxidoreductase subunit 5